MDNVIQWSKYQAETVSIVMPFSDELSPGDTIIGVPLITVSVFTGLDANPSNLLYQGVTITNGNTIEQRFRLGIPGVVYHITFSIQTVAGDTLEKESYLAILPDEDGAVPNFLPLWESTQLYPYQVMESVTSRMMFTGGRLLVTVISDGPDAVQSHSTWVGGTLQVVGITYNIPHEDLKGNIQWIGGTLQPASTITYNDPHDDLKGGIAWLGGTLQNASITYSIPHEDLKGSIQFTGGSLV